MTQNNEPLVPPVPNIQFPDTVSPAVFFTQRVLPAVYGDELSYYEVLAKLADTINEVLEGRNQDNDDLKAVYEYLEELRDVFEKFVESGFEDYYEQDIEKWINANFEAIMQKFIGIGLYFGLTSDGYFCAYVPSSWNEIQFDTGAVYGAESYGCLILRYDVTGGRGVIDNTGEYDAVGRIPGDALRKAAGNGLACNKADGTLSVPPGSNLRYASDGIDVPEADAVTAGAVKISHEIGNDGTDGAAASPDAVYAFAQPR